MCSFYFYYTHFSPVCQGADRHFFVFAVLTKFDRLCYNKALGHTENGRRLIHAPRRECMHMKLDIIVKLVSIVCDVFKAYLAYLNSQNKRK